MKNRKMGRPVKNRYKVPTRQWANWSNFAKGTYNRMYHSLRNQSDILPISTAKFYARREWNAFRYTVATQAADIADAI